MSTLAQRMREAANTLEEASERYLANDPLFYEWNPQRLRIEADQVEAEDSESAPLVEEMTRDLLASMGNLEWRLPEGPSTLEEWCRAHARHLIESGWRKGEPE